MRYFRKAPNKPKKNVKEKDKKEINMFNLEKKKLKKRLLDFYDIIINLDSLNNINTGWKILMNEKGKNFIKKNNPLANLVIGFLGNINSGKTFLSQKITDEYLEKEVNTIGLNIKITKENYVLIDPAGSASPLYGEFQNFPDKLRDKFYTEEFIKTFIIKYSNISFLVVGFLTFSEQKLIKRIYLDYKTSNKNKDKNLIIIHNLQTFQTKEQVQNYIDNILLQSSTFKIIKYVYTSGDKQFVYFYDKDDLSIKHIIFANDNSEAGIFYNANTIDFIKHINKIFNHKYSFNFKEILKEHFENLGEKMFDINPGTKLHLTEEKNIKIDINENKIDKNLIKEQLNLKYEGNKINLKNIFIEDFGVYSFINDEFHPDYECYHNGKELVIKIDCCGKGTEFTVQKLENEQYEYNFVINGEKKINDKEENSIKYIKKRQNGSCCFYITFKNDKLYPDNLQKKEKKNGMQYFIYPLLEIKK